jgi:hypothetical protein
VLATRQDVFGGYSLVGSTTDAIPDRQTGETIDLSAIDACAKPLGNQACSLVTGAFSDTAGQLRIENGALLDGRTGQTVSGDTNGDRIAGMLPELSPHVQATILPLAPMRAGFIG